MCGIVGYTGEDDITTALGRGLEKLEYRGYDSAGVALAESGGLRVIRSVGRVAKLEEKLRGVVTDARCGIGHTRWATHGSPTEINCHPHLSFGRRFAVVHNGVIENCRKLRELCEDRGISPVSDTDSELIAHLLELFFDGDVISAVRRTAEMLEGSFAVAALHAGEPDVIYAFRRSSPLIIGVSPGRCGVASDGCAAEGDTLLLGDGQYARISPAGAKVWENGKRVSPGRISGFAVGSHGTAGYEHYMMKEIAEQPGAAARTIESLSHRRLSGSLAFIGCGSSYNAALSVLPLAEHSARRGASAFTAGEFLLTEKLSGRGRTAVAISQSGETADTVAAAREAAARGWSLLAVANVPRSSLTRVCRRCALTQAGPEISVATTKGFTSQVAALAAMLARGALRDEVRRLPAAIEKALAAEADAETAAELFAPDKAAFFIGRRADVGAALEGALKLREITYIPAIGLAAGELKHGSIALIEDGTPVVLVHTDPALKDKTLLTAATVKARGGRVIAVTHDDEVAAAADLALRIPEVPPLISPAVSVVPMQLLAYHAALRLARDIDKPRNLAKSVTVE